MIAIGQNVSENYLESGCEEGLEFDWNNKQIIYIEKYMQFSMWIWIYVVYVCLMYSPKNLHVLWLTIT